MADDLQTPSPGLPPDAIAQRSFATVRRGFDPDEVRAFLGQAATALERAQRREQELLHDLHAAEEKARHPVIDEAVLTSALGQRSAAVLRGAHEEAARILSQAEETAAGMLRDAQQQATDAQVNAESSAAERIAEAELEANALRQQARDEAAAVLDVARAEGEDLIERAREHCRAMLDQAQEARRRVLADLAQRRRIVTDQIEQFRAARDQVAGSVVGVRRSLDRIVEDLANADEAARNAAAAAARPHPAGAPESVLVEEGERAAEEVGLGAGSEYAATQLPAAERAPSSQPTEGVVRRMLRFDDIATVVSPDQQHGEPFAVATAAVPAEPPAVESPAVALHDWASEPRGAEPAPASPDRVDMAADAALGAEPAGVVEVAPDAPPAEEHANGTSSVEGLFARLRAHQHQAGERDEREVVDVGEQPAHETPPGHEGDPAADVPVPTQADATDATADVSGPGEGDTVDEPETADEPEKADEPETADEPDTAERAALARRAAILDPLVTTMARRLKRALQDDQNGLLDRLRQGTGDWSDEILLDEATQRALYEKAAAGAVRDAVAGGIGFARELSGSRAKAPSVDQHTVDAVCEELSTTIVTLLRRRLEGGEIADAAERVGAAYREWRGERIERLAEDSAIAAFGEGVLSGSAKRSNVRWVRSEVGTGCADCEDNALSEAMAPGEAFPTGHLRPPAHPGCRCLVLPTPSS